MGFSLSDIPGYNTAKTILGGGASADLGPAKQVVGEGINVEQGLGAQRNAFGAQMTGPQYNPYFANQNLIQQQGAINDLGQAAAGRVPSPAELQLRQQGAANASQAFGLAAAMQGRSPGAALRIAQKPALQTQTQTNAQAGIQRAQEQQAARQAYFNALQGLQGQVQGQRGQDITQYGNLLQGQIGALNAAGSAAGAYSNASAANAAGKNAMYGGLISSGASLAALSDEREKTDVEPAKLDELASNLKGFAYRYKDPKFGRGDRVGVMAQDVAKSDLGKRIVIDGKPLKLDIGNAVGAALGMSAEALKRTKRAA
jgi:hypothetical protein